MGAVTVWEAQGQAALGGASQGMVDGVGAVAFARSIHQPKGSGIYAAIDFDAAGAGDMPVTLAYLAAFKGVCNSAGYLGGVYGGASVITSAITSHSSDLGWQTEAWSYGAVSAQACLLQMAPPITLAGYSVDIDTALHPFFGGWNLAGLWPKPPPPWTPGSPPTLGPTQTYLLEDDVKIATIPFRVEIENGEGYCLLPAGVSVSTLIGTPCLIGPDPADIHQYAQVPSFRYKTPDGRLVFGPVVAGMSGWYTGELSALVP